MSQPDLRNVQEVTERKREREQGKGWNGKVFNRNEGDLDVFQDLQRQIVLCGEKNISTGGVVLSPYDAANLRKHNLKRKSRPSVYTQHRRSGETPPHAQYVVCC